MKSKSGLQVEVINNNVEAALRVLKRKVKDSGLLVELKRRSFYEKPSDYRRRKNNQPKARRA